MKNKIIIISSPSGAGKTTICKHLIKKINNVEISISYTTRTKRKSEKNNRDYYFINQKNFQKLKNKNYFIETAKVFDNFYGSPKTNITNAFKRKNHILFDIDWQGAKKLRKKYNKKQIIDFFILPPNIRELRKRLEKRGRDNKKEIKKRLDLAISEMRHYNEYKFVLFNDQITETVNNLKTIIDSLILIEETQSKIKNYKF